MGSTGGCGGVGGSGGVGGFGNVGVFSSSPSVTVIGEVSAFKSFKLILIDFPLSSKLNMVSFIGFVDKL